jgi:hypothetical protein
MKSLGFEEACVMVPIEFIIKKNLLAFFSKIKKLFNHTHIFEIIVNCPLFVVVIVESILWALVIQ